MLTGSLVQSGAIQHPGYNDFKKTGGSPESETKNNKKIISEVP
jgi:hypothetical protein